MIVKKYLEAQAVSNGYHVRLVEVHHLDSYDDVKRMARYNNLKFDSSPGSEVFIVDTVDTKKGPK